MHRIRAIGDAGFTGSQLCNRLRRNRHGMPCPDGPHHALRHARRRAAPGATA
jgi:hypothetical protein